MWPVILSRGARELVKAGPVWIKDTKAKYFVYVNLVSASPDILGSSNQEKLPANKGPTGKQHVAKPDVLAQEDQSPDFALGRVLVTLHVFSPGIVGS